MVLKYVMMLLCVLVISINAGAQRTGRDGEPEKPQKVFITAGPEINLILPVAFGSDSKGLYTQSFTDTSGNPQKLETDTMGIFRPLVSFRLGMNVRFDFSRTFSFQTGLYYIQRSYSAEVGVTDANRNDIVTPIAEQNLKYTGFELPLMGLFYVQLGREWFMNNAVGFSIDFFPSSVIDTALVSGVGRYAVFGGRNSWVIPSIKAAVGFEWRTPKAGYFYLGGQFHRPLIPIFEGLIQKQTASGGSLWGSDYISASVSGTYFAVDFKWFFPPGRENKFLKR